MHNLPFRQVHLDFHTTEMIERIAGDFSKKQFQEMLKLGYVDSITVFSKCHHGWSYHPTHFGEMHPGLAIDLLQNMIESAHEINVKTPVYLSAGFDERLARLHPEWLFRQRDERLGGAVDFMQPGFHLLCFNSPYLDILADQIREAIGTYDADGVFLDIVGIRECYCQNCVRTLRKEGRDPRDPAVVRELAERVYLNYIQKVNDTVRSIKPDTPIFHNSGHI